jgi:hypothetical protein
MATVSAPSAMLSFSEQLMADALYLRGFIAARGLYSRELLDAKALVDAINLAEQELAQGGALTAATENTLLSALSDVLRRLKCSTIDDLKRAETPRFKLALNAGRVVVFATMFLCISLALPLTLAFNQLTGLSKEIDAALTKDKLDTYFKNRVRLETLAAQASSPAEGSQGDVVAEQAALWFELTMQDNAWGSLAEPPAMLRFLFGPVEELYLQPPAEEAGAQAVPEASLAPPPPGAGNVEEAVDATQTPVTASPAPLLPASGEAAPGNDRTQAWNDVAFALPEIATHVGETWRSIGAVKRTSETWSFLLNNGILPLLYGMLGAAVFLSRRYMSMTSELWASNPLTDALMRIGLGGMAGLIVGWFQTPDGVRELTTTPFALAFIAGFSIDIVFSLLERVVAAFDFRKPA